MFDSFKTKNLQEVNVEQFKRLDNGETDEFFLMNPYELRSIIMSRSPFEVIEIDDESILDRPSSLIEDLELYCRMLGMFSIGDRLNLNLVQETAVQIAKNSDNPLPEVVMFLRKCWQYGWKLFEEEI